MIIFKMYFMICWKSDTIHWKNVNVDYGYEKEEDFMAISEEQVKHVAKLAKLSFSDDELHDA